MTRRPPARYYPLFASLAGKRCVVVGGGPVAARKVAGLLSAGAAVTVVSPAVSARLRQLARAGRLRWAPRAFRAADLNAAWLAFAATDDQAVNRAVSRAGAARRIFVNVVDQVPLCSFIAPAVTTRGRLTVAISTGGASPTLAKLVKRRIGATVGREYGPMAALLAALREPAKRRLPRYGDRKRYFEAVVTGGLARRLQQRGARSARRHALALLDRFAGIRSRT